MLSSLDIVRTRNAIESTALGKKVFSLYPPPVLSEVAEELARNEYEIYLIHDHRKLRRVLPSNGESVLFVNIDESPEGTNWESYIGEIMCDSGCKDVGVGILTMNTIEPPIRERYLTKLKIPCGSVMLRFGMSKNIEILTKTLEACKARGNRRYVRALCPPGSGRCNVEFDGSTILRRYSRYQLRRDGRNLRTRGFAPTGNGVEKAVDSDKGSPSDRGRVRRQRTSGGRRIDGPHSDVPAELARRASLGKAQTSRV